MANTVDLEFDRYGDLSLFGNDLSILNSSFDFTYQNVIDRLITNFGDYDLYRSFGANMSSYIGGNNNAELEEAVVRSIKRSLIDDGFLSVGLVSVVSLREDADLFIKITIGNPLNALEENIVINSIFNTSSGLLYVTN